MKRKGGSRKYSTIRVDSAKDIWFRGLYCFSEVKWGEEDRGRYLAWGDC